MKLLFSFLLFSAAFLVTLLLVGPQINSIVRDWNNSPNIIYDQEVFLKLDLILPADKTVYWWLFSSEEWQQAVRRHPEVHSLQLEKCTTFSFSCFEISITRRVPVLQADIAGDIWLLSHDGSFYRPLLEDCEDCLVAFNNLPLILGLEQFQGSNQRLSSVLAGTASIHAAFRKYEESLAKEGRTSALILRSLEPVTSTEYLIGFRSLPFPFRVRLQDKGIDTSVFAHIEKLVSAFDKNALTSILEVDLGYDGMAVVRRDEGAR